MGKLFSASLIVLVPVLVFAFVFFIEWLDARASRLRATRESLGGEVEGAEDGWDMYY